jgi:hypothetical protein
MTNETTTPDTTFSVSLTFTHKMLADVITTFVESGDPVTCSWCRKIRPSCTMAEAARRFGRPWYADVKLYQVQQNETILLITAENDKAPGDFEKAITMADFTRGLALLAQAKDKKNGAIGIYAHQFQNILEDNHDSTTADLFMQLVVYGEEVFA